MPGTSTLRRSLTAAPIDSLLVVSAYEYINFTAVSTWLTRISSHSIILTSTLGVGHIISKQSLVPVTKVQWWNSRGRLPVVHASHALIFYDGVDKTVNRSIAHIARLGIPMTVVDSQSNPVDPGPIIRANLTHKDKRMPDSTSTVTPIAKPRAKPPVIVDAPNGTNKHVRVYVELPAATFNEYQQQADSVGHSVEKILSDRLRTSVTFTSGRGLYFTDALRAELERITGGHIFNSPEDALQRMKNLVSLKISDDISIEITGTLLTRAASRAKSERKTLDQYLRHYCILGLRKFVGLEPW